MDDTDRGPLSGITVVELASFISAPLACMMLADLGADVVKVEPPSGDPMRRLGRHPSGISPMFVNANRGKRGLTLDLKEAAAQRRLRDLLSAADVLVCNWRSGVAARLGLDDAELAAANPRLIRVYVSGFGRAGPLADSPVFDSVIQGRLGLTEAYGDGTTPQLDASFSVDKMSALMVCQSTLAAIAGRELHGVADRVDIAMFDAAAYANYVDVMVNRTLVEFEPPSARSEQPSTVRPLATADGWVLVVPMTADQIRRALRAAGIEDRFDQVIGVSDGLTLTRRFYSELEPVLRGGTTASWLAAMEAHDVPAAPCLTIDEHLADEQTVHNELYQVHEWPDWAGVGPMRQVRHPAVFDTWGRLHSSGGPPALA